MSGIPEVVRWSRSRTPSQVKKEAALLTDSDLELLKWLSASAFLKSECGNLTNLNYECADK